MMELLSDKEWFRSPNQSSSPALAWGLGDLAHVNRLGEGSLFFGMESSPSSGSSKRARAPNNGAQVVSCLVDGCISDLSKCRDYHRRHKVCEDHSKTPKVTIGGHEQRFCQQCSRFHSLVEFDEGKRSCRKRLDGHNRRRRKPQPESLAFNSGRFLSSQPATRFMPFSSPEIFPTTAVGSSTWDSTLKAQNDSLHYNTHPQLNFIDRKSSFLGSFPHSYGGGKQFPFLQGSDSTLTESSVCQSLPNHVPTLKIGGSSRKLFADGSNSVTNNSDRALSLLSSPPTETREIGLSHIMQPHQTPPAQCLFPRSQYSASGMDGVPISSVLAAGSSNSSNMYCQGMFQIEPDESSASASHQTISFSWE